MIDESTLNEFELYITKIRWKFAHHYNNFQKIVPHVILWVINIVERQLF